MKPKSVPPWVCPYCAKIVDTPDRYVDAIDHMLDHHRSELIRDRPIIARVRV
jgi:hypothetical protein